MITALRGVCMAHNHWSELFPPHIWKRGRDYYRDGRIMAIRRSKNRIIAEIEGTELYIVSVSLDPVTNRIEDHSCNCPYGEDGTPCKHLAALLCSLEDDNGIALVRENISAVETTVGLLSEKQMRQLLIQFAADEPFIWEKILLTATNQLPKSIKHQWEHDLQQLTDNVADRHGFIEYEDAYDYCCSLQEYLYNRVPDLLGKGLVMEAFELVCLVFQTGMEQDLDDSDGGLTVLATYCMGEWNKILSLASSKNQKEMYSWFCEAYKKGELMQLFLEDYIFQAPWDAEIATDLLTFLDRQIQCAEGERQDYRLNELITHRIRWMNEIGVSQEERKLYIQQNHHLSAVRDIEIEEAKHNEDWCTALALLEESKVLDADKIGLVARYSEQIIEIYETLHDIPAVKKELEYYLFTFRQDDLKYVEKMKVLLSASEWENMRQKLLDSKTMVSQSCALLSKEGLYEQLMDKIEAHGFIHTLQQYEDLLMKKFPQRCMRMYEVYLHQAMQQASNRKAYWSVIQTLKKLKKYPDGKAAAQSIADQWKQEYPRRTSLLDELNKAGF